MVINQLIFLMMTDYVLPSAEIICTSAVIYMKNSLQTDRQ